MTDGRRRLRSFARAPGGSSSVGRASAFQAECRGFETRLPLQTPFLRSSPPPSGPQPFVGSAEVEVRIAAKRVTGLIRHPGRVVPAVRRRLRSQPPRPARPPSRLDIITGPLDLSGHGLEIGASWRPLLPKADGYDVRVADHLDQAGLVAKYDGLRPTEAIESVDYVLTGTSLTDTIDERFDWIVGSHVLEHTVCLVTFLRDVESLLRPGGILSLAVPDRRYCLDRFRDRTSLGRVIDVFRSGPAVHSEGSVLEFYLDVVTKGDSISWAAGQTGSFRQRHTLDEAREQAAIAAAGEYVDVHNWVFTPNHLRLLLVDLHALGFIGLARGRLPRHGRPGVLHRALAGRAGARSVAGRSRPTRRARGAIHGGHRVRGDELRPGHGRRAGWSRWHRRAWTRTVGPRGLAARLDASGRDQTSCSAATRPAATAALSASKSRSFWSA